MTVRRVTVVGASLAGLCTARALRSEGFDGQITLIGDELHRPYDRPPLSKEFLAGTMSTGDLGIEGTSETLDVRYLLGETAVQLLADRAVLLTGGRRVEGDAVVLATGARARSLPLGQGLGGVHTLRTIEDAAALAAELMPGRRLVVIGAGFLGAEVASTARQLGLEVTVVEVAPIPLAASLGVHLGAVVARLHERAGVHLITGSAPVALSGEGQVHEVLLGDGQRLPANVVLVAVGAVPNTEWLASCGLDVAEGVRCDAFGFTGIDGVYAVGDCAAWFDPFAGRHHRVEHWTSALERPVPIAQHIVHNVVTSKVKPSYFWSQQYDVRIQFAGTVEHHDEVSIEDGDLDSSTFLAVYRRLGEPIAVLGLNHMRLFSRWRRSLPSC